MPVLLLHGENSFLLRQKVSEFKQKFLAEEGDLNLAIFNARETDERTIIGAYETPPFLGQQRLVIVQDFDFKKSAPLLARALTGMPEYATLLILSPKADSRTVLFKAIKAHGQILEFAALKPTEFEIWLDKVVREKGLKIEPDALECLSTFTMGNCEAAMSEIDKLKTYADEEKITRRDVEILVHPDLHTSVFRFTDAIGERRHQAALLSLQDLVNRGENLLQIFFMIVRQFRLLLTIQALLAQKLSPTEIARQLKVHPFVVQNTLRQVRNFSYEELRRAHQKLLMIDTAVKTGKVSYSSTNPIEFSFELEKFIIGFG